MKTISKEDNIEKLEGIRKLFSEDSINLPLERIEKTFMSFLQEVFERFKLLIRSEEFNSLFTEIQIVKLEVLCNCIIKSVEYYYEGQISKAYKELSIGILGVREYLDKFNANFDEKEEYLYRMRIGTNHSYTREEMFHIPFHLRGKVSTQRYSIPGLPSLYLGSSLYICWEELNRPNFNSVQVARFKKSNGETVKYIDFGYPPKILAFLLAREARLNKSIEVILDELVLLGSSYIMCWPLLAACSIKVTNRDDIFKPEYIVPQLLLQWVTEHSSYDGIRYFSVSVNGNKKSYNLFHNYVFPAISNKEKGLCSKLGQLFEVSEPISWQYTKVLTSNESFKISKSIRSGKLPLSSNSEVRYCETDFADLETIVDRGEMFKVAFEIEG